MPSVCIFYCFNERHEMSDDNSCIVILYSVSGKLFFLFLYNYEIFIITTKPK